MLEADTSSLFIMGFKASRFGGIERFEHLFIEGKYNYKEI